MSKRPPAFNTEDFPSLQRSKSAEGPDEPDGYIPEYVPLTSASLNLEEQLLAQYNRAGKLLHEAGYDKNTPLSQKASALNSATAILSALTKMQAELYSLERVKVMESCLIETLKNFPEVQAEFLDKYEAALAEAAVD